MRTKKMSKKQLAVSLVSSALILQAACYSSALADSTIVGSGGALTKTPETGAYDIRPEAINGNTGFRKFTQFELGNGDVANFIFRALNEKVSDGSGETSYTDISRFVSLVDGKITVNGMINALDNLNGSLSGGHLIFVSPNGMIVGSSGVLNVGQLSVLTPTNDSYDLLKKAVPSYSDFNTTLNQPHAVITTADFDDWNNLNYSRGTGVIQIDASGRVAARGNVNFDGGSVITNGIVFAAVNDETVIKVQEAEQNLVVDESGQPIKDADGNYQFEYVVNKTYNPEEQAKNLFESLVNARTTSGNSFSGTNGEIVITAGNGITVGNGAMIVNNSGTGGSISMTNYGSNGININGEVRNNSAANGIVNITNKAGQLNVGSTGLVQQANGEMTFLNDGDSLNIVEAGQVINTGTLAMTNNGAKGFNISGIVTNTGDATLKNTGAGNFDITSTGKVTNNTGKLTLQNTSGAGTMYINGTVTSNGPKMEITNNGTAMSIGGKVYMTNTSGETTITNTNGQLLIDKTETATGLVQSDGAKLTINNSGAGGLNVKGKVTNNNELSMENSGSEGFNVTGIIENTGTAKLTNQAGGTKGFNVENSGEITAHSGSVEITNYGSNGINIDGTVKNESTASGVVKITNYAGGLNVGSTGLVQQTSGEMTILNETDADSLNITAGGQVINTGTLTMTNKGANGFNTSGSITNTGATTLTNTGSNGFNLASTGRITNNGSSLKIDNSGSGGANFRGITKTTDSGTIEVVNTNSDVRIGDDSDNNYYFDSTGDVTFTVTNGNILNRNSDNTDGVKKTHIRTSNGKNLVMNVTNGRIGDEVGPCADGVCTGIGIYARDWRKSINTNIDGTITATSTADTNTSLINIGSADKDMHVNQIKADGRVILLADDITNKNGTDYNILNSSENAAKPNVEGAGISMIASNNIGSSSKALTFRQNGVEEVFDGDDAREPHVYQNNTDLKYGVDMLADNNIYVKGLDADSDADGNPGNKVDTNVCAMIARKGDIDAEFSGDTYIDQTTAQNNITIKTRGKNLVIDNLGTVPDYSQDYYGENGNVVPEHVKLTALDLGTKWADSPDYRYAADSTIVVKNGKINGTTEGRPNTQDLELVADNAYAGGYYFNMGKHRGQNGDKFNPSTVTQDSSTNPITNSDGNAISIRGKAVRPSDVNGEGTRNYYYGGSEQGDDPNYDKDGTIMDDDVKGTENDDDNLVVPEPTTPPAETTPPPAETTPPPAETTPPPAETTPPPAETTPPPAETTPPPAETTPPPAETTPPPAETTPPPAETTPPPAETTPAPTTPAPEPLIDRKGVDDATYIQNKDVTDYVPTIDKRQFMRFDTRYTENPVVLVDSGNGGVNQVLDISRGGVSLAHDNSLKVGDVVPIHIQYGDIDINTQVKVVMANDLKAGAEFVNLDAATANKLLYLSLLMNEGYGPGNIQIQATYGNNLSSLDNGF